MQLTGVHHVSLNVADHAAALPFYTDVLGLAELPRPDFEFPGAWLDVGDGRQIHLIEVEGWEAPSGQHFAFEVADLDAALAHLDAHGVRHSDVIEIPGTGARQAFTKDPAGNRIEFNQPG